MPASEPPAKLVRPKKRRYLPSAGTYDNLTEQKISTNTPQTCSAGLSLTKRENGFQWHFYKDELRSTEDDMEMNTTIDNTE